MASLDDVPTWARNNKAYYVDFSKALPDSTKDVQSNKPLPANVGWNANVLSSEKMDAPESWPTHTIMLDLDVPHKLVPSSTPGHSHLYIDVDLDPHRYEALLVALRDAGIIQTGILQQFDVHGATFLRLPDVKKKTNDLSS